jgi:hypothetical protein
MPHSLFANPTKLNLLSCTNNIFTPNCISLLHICFYFLLQILSLAEELERTNHLFEAEDIGISSALNCEESG